MKHFFTTGSGKLPIGLPIVLGLLALATALIVTACDSPIVDGGGHTTYGAEYTVTFNADGGKPAPDNQSVAVGGKVTQPADMTRDGYTFGGWYKEATFATLWDFAADTVTENITLYAKWTLGSGPGPGPGSNTSYTITYNLDGGTNHASNPATYTIASAAITLRAPTKDNARFDGWYDNAQFNGSAVTTIAAGSTGNKTFWAKWTPTGSGTLANYWLNEEGHIAFSSGAAATVTNAAGQSVTITASGDGYTGQHWYVKGVEDISATGESSYTFNATGKAAGVYKIGLRVSKDSQQYSAEFTVTVTAAE